jgi:hypothetical protein
MLVHANHSQMVDEVAAAGISRGTCHRILSDALNKSYVTQNSVQCILTQAQYHNRMSTCSRWPDWSADKNGMVLNQITTGDETWSFLYYPQLKWQLATWKSPSSPRKKKPRQDRPRGKVMLELFFDSSAIVHVEFVQDRVTVNMHHTKEILHHLQNWICHRCHEFWHRKTWVLLHNIALHIALCLPKRSWLNKWVTILSHPRYSRDLIPHNLFFFPHSKEKLCGHQFQSSEEIISSTR